MTSIVADHDAEEADRTRAARDVLRESHPDARAICLVTLTGLAIFYTLYFAAAIILPFLFALVLNLLLQPAKRLLSTRLGVPASLTALLLIAALVIVIAGIVTAISVPASGWIAKAPQGLPVLRDRLGFLAGPIDMMRHAMDHFRHLLDQAPPEGQARVAVSQPNNLGGVGITVLENTREAAAQLLTLGVVLFFMLSKGDSLIRRLVEIIPTFGDKRRVVEIADEIERNVSSYLATITVMNLLVGVGNGVSMWAQGMPDPLLWGVLAFLLNYIPILGPVSGIVIFFFVGLFTTPSLLLAAGPSVVYFIIHVIEGETVTPMLLARRFTLNPVLVIVWLFFWNWLWGIPGAFLAVPLLAIVKIVCDRVERLTPLGHLLGAPAPHGRSRA